MKTLLNLIGLKLLWSHNGLFILQYLGENFSPGLSWLLWPSPGMTVNHKKYRAQPASSSNDPGLRFGATQMDDSDSRPKPLSEDLAEPINLEDSHYTQLRLELENDAHNLEAESWSVTVDQSYMKTMSKEAVKRQDVIYELMQTEMHHVRTLKILLYVYMYELKQSTLVDDVRLERLFPGVDALLSHHQHFLHCLKSRLKQSQEEDGSNNYQIRQLGDILITQFSGSLGEGMKECYSVFCRHHSEAYKLYKEQLHNSKKFQNLIKKIGHLPLVRRLGIPECFLLVTQRITKYPVLVERLMHNTEADTDEHKSLVQGLALIKDTISQVNEQVDEYEKAVRLKEICWKLEPKSQGRIMDDKFLRREDLVHGNRTLLHESSVTWKTSGRQKDVHIVLLSDVLLLLHEKDQKLVFATVDNKPPVISLRGLIVREVAHEEKAMYLICSCTSNMYEIHTGSKDERIRWMSLIREAVNRFMEEEEFYSVEMAPLQQYQNSLKECDEQLRQILETKQQISVALYEAVTGQESPHRGLLLRGDASDLQQGETLVREAISEVENLQSLLMLKVQRTQSGGNEVLEASGSNLTPNTNGDGAEGQDATDPNSDLQLEETFFSESLELSADDDDSLMPHSVSPLQQFSDDETLLVYERVVLLTQKLNTLQAALAQQSSQMELLQALQSKSKRSARYYNPLLEQENQRNMEKQKEELANLHKMQAQHREEQQRWEKERERQRVQMEVLEAEVRHKEEQCRMWEEKLKAEKVELEAQRDDYQHDLERLRESLRTLEKDKERHNQEKERLEKLKRNTSLMHHAYLNLDDTKSLSSYQSFRGSTLNGVETLTPKPFVPSLNVPRSDPKEIPPKVPPRRESISPKPPKAHVPLNLQSHSNEVRRSSTMMQQIPKKLAMPREKKEKGRGSHNRTNSAANIDVSQVVPIRGKEGGSLRARRTGSPPRIHHQSDLFKPPGSTQNMKPSPSLSSHRRNHIDASPPAPPPFPKDILDPHPPKEKVIFL